MFCFVCFSQFFFLILFTFCLGENKSQFSIQYNRARACAYLFRACICCFYRFFVLFLLSFFYLHRDRDYFRSIFLRLISNFFFYIASQIYERPKGSNKNLCFSRKPNLMGSDLKKCTQRVISPIFSLSQLLIIFLRTSSEQFLKQNTIFFQ